MSENDCVVAKTKNTHHLNQFFSVFFLANITGGPSHLDVLALKLCHSLFHIGLPPAAHHHMGSSPSQSLRCSETDSEEEKLFIWGQMSAALSYCKGNDADSNLHHLSL